MSSQKKSKSKDAKSPESNHPWDRAARLTLHRVCPRAPHYSHADLEPGVNYFVLQLERLGAITHFSCEGHPAGFYITFECDEKLARRIHACGFFSVEIENSDNSWSLRKHTTKNERDHIQALRWAAEAWEKHLGPLEMNKSQAQ